MQTIALRAAYAVLRFPHTFAFMSPFSPSWLKRRKQLLFASPLRKLVFARPYPYMHSPQQLAQICALTKQALSAANGCILEVGSAYGETTVYVNRFLQTEGIPPRPYHCLDTFEGFTSTDVEHEQKIRGKQDSFHAFRVNDRQWVAYMMAENKLNNVTLHQGDANTFEYASVGPIAFCLVDTDIYLPTKHAIQQAYQYLQPGGIIVVDDCKENNQFDGALQAYHECVQAYGMEPRIEKDQGILIKP